MSFERSSTRIPSNDSGNVKNGKPINITGKNRISFEWDCINGTIVNGTREPILYSSVRDKPPGRKI